MQALSSNFRKQNEQVGGFVLGVGHFQCIASSKVLKLFPISVAEIASNVAGGCFISSPPITSVLKYLNHTFLN